MSITLRPTENEMRWWAKQGQGRGLCQPRGRNWRVLVGHVALSDISRAVALSDGNHLLGPLSSLPSQRGMPHRYRGSIEHRDGFHPREHRRSGVQPQLRAGFSRDPCEEHVLGVGVGVHADETIGRRQIDDIVDSQR